jgi:pimeloyl-ACP methyl ester carboxylesterase
MAVQSAPAADIVLVHGLFIGPWAWQPVIDCLEPDFTVYAPELPFVSLQGDAQVVRQQVAACRQAGRSVLLLGHSYGGMVISEAGEEATEMAFLGALAPDPGQTTAGISEECVSALCNQATVTSDDGKTVTLDGPTTVAAFYHLCTSEQAAYGMARHRPAPASIFLDPSRSPAWLRKPSTYIVTSEDRSVDPNYQRSRGSLMKATKTVTADHSAFFSAPNELAEVIAAIARSCQLPG